MPLAVGIKSSVLQWILLGHQPHDSNVDLPRIHSSIEEFLEPGRQDPKVTIVVICPSYLSHELKLLWAVSQDPETGLRVNPLASI